MVVSAKLNALKFKSLLVSKGVFSRLKTGDWMAKDEKLYLIIDDTANSGKGYCPEGLTEDEKRDFDLMMKRLKEKYDNRQASASTLHELAVSPHTRRARRSKQRGR